MLIFNKNVDKKLLKRELLNCLTNFEFYFKGDAIITSGFRTPEHNLEVGGSPTSSHLKGLACDVACSNSRMMCLIVIYGFLAGFRRFGLAKDHVHLDVDPDKPQFCIWLE